MVYKMHLIVTQIDVDIGGGCNYEVNALAPHYNFSSCIQFLSSVQVSIAQNITYTNRSVSNQPSDAIKMNITSSSSFNILACYRACRLVVVWLLCY